VATGKYVEIKLSKEMVGYRPLRWLSQSRVEFANGASSWTIVKTKDQWLPASVTSSVQDVHQQSPAVKMEIREDPNTPPALYVIDIQEKRSQKVLDISPNLSRFALGRVEMVEWKDGEKRDWKGRLYFPPDYHVGERYPLVVQTHGFASANEFSLLGWSDDIGTGYAAEPLASRGIIVLQIQDPPFSTFLSPSEPRAAIAEFESGIQMLKDKELIDTKKVGLLAFSRTGWYVDYALSHSDFPYAAAIDADAGDFGYLDGLLKNWMTETAADLGGEPAGVGLKAWMENSNAFNTNRIRTPLRKEIDNTDIYTEWEMYSLMKRFHLPIELVVAPDAVHGEHPVQMPAQKLASEEGTVDWFDFWLNDRKSMDPRKREQYVRWEILKKERDAAAEVPRPPLLNWTATPIVKTPATK
jgi:dipeptidyl aminopeptidase/acylaminoacyl peptidase